MTQRFLRFGISPLFAVALAAGCAHSPLDLAQGGPSGKPAGPYRLLEVPFFPDTTRLCGPASLAAVMNYWRVPVGVDQIAKAVYLPDLRGTLPFDLARFPREHGLRAADYFGGLEDLKSQIRKGHPLIAYLNLGSSRFPSGHFLVVIGYTEDGKWLIAHSGGEKEKPIPVDRFLAAWEKMDYWTLLVLPKEGEPSNDG
jgi:ABC-type bacteriocin/lantibiotic exporter with double-glycine peptidase domain